MKKSFLKVAGLMSLFVTFSCSDSDEKIETANAGDTTSITALKSNYLPLYRSMMEESIDNSINALEDYVTVQNNELVFDEYGYKNKIASVTTEDYFSKLGKNPSEVIKVVSEPFPKEINWNDTHYSNEQSAHVHKLYDDLNKLSEDARINKTVLKYNDNVTKDDKLTQDQKIELLLLGEYLLVIDNYVVLGKFDKVSDILGNKYDTILKGRCKVSGRNMAIGAVIGATTGAIGGAKIGAVGGTVTIPGIGTAAGAVGGAVFGGFMGFVGGALSSVAHDLISTCFR